jgi:hypothetical protein
MIIFIYKKLEKKIQSTTATTGSGAFNGATAD